MSDIAIVSSGDPEKDRKELASAELHRARMDQNICPNGCGYMKIDDPHTRRCEVCGFVGWQNTPINLIDNKGVCWACEGNEDEPHTC